MRLPRTQGGAAPAGRSSGATADLGAVAAGKGGGSGAGKDGPAGCREVRRLCLNALGTPPKGLKQCRRLICVSSHALATGWKLMGTGQETRAERLETGAFVLEGGGGSLDRDTNSGEGEAETKGKPFRT